jgi:hypothetical protein
MMHFPIHLVEELFICGPVHMRWMYLFERYIKELKGFVTNKAKPEGKYGKWIFEGGFNWNCQLISI